jgi:putative endopeptidase
MAQPAAKQHYIDKNNMDLSVRPQDDFYQYANGGWIKTAKIPASKSSWGSFNELDDRTKKNLKTLLTKAAAAKAPKGSNLQRVGDFYLSGMDSAGIEKLGYSPIKADLKAIDQIQNFSDYIDTYIRLRKAGANAGAFFGLFVGQDSKFPDRYIVSFSQGGTSLPDRDNYLKDDTRSVKLRTAMIEYNKTLFMLTGSTAEQAIKQADGIMQFEKALAKAQKSRVEMRDPTKTYNKFSIEDFNKKTPRINWSTIMAGLGIKGADSVLCNNPSFFVAIDSIAMATPIETLKDYFKASLLRSTAPYLSSAFVDAGFRYNQAVSGQKEQTPRWERISGVIDGSIGDLLGQLYVNEYFNAESKKRMLELVNNLQKVFENRIKNLDWMSEETKQKALAKLNAFGKKIGYPDVWKKYEGVEISKNKFLQNVRQCAVYAFNDNINRLGKPVDKTRWAMTPPTINAYYSPLNNEIAFPAGILQFPFFDFGADDAVNYGGIGAVIGHEMTHGFDDNGRRYAADGSLTDWWTAEDAKKFDEKAKMVSDLYSSYVVLDSLHVNGKLTNGENIADIGGVAIAYEAFQNTQQAKEGKLIDGFTPNQRFFLSFAQIWRNIRTNESLANQVQTDPHSPAQFRTNGPLSNMNEFYQAFDVKEGDKMYRNEKDRIRIW